MKISPLSFLNNQKISKVQQNKILNNNLQSDVFVKSNSAISFTSTRIVEKYHPLSTQMASYIIKSEDVTIEGIEAIIQKFSPYASFDDMKNLQVNRPITSGAFGFTKIPVDIMQLGDRFVSIKKPFSIYAKMPEDMSERNRLILLDNLLHECTHLFQEESKDRTSSADFFCSKVQKSKNPKATLDEIERMPSLFTALEEDMYEILISSKLEFDSLPREIRKNITVDSVCKDFRGKKATETFMYLIAGNLKYFNVNDDLLALDYIIFKAKNEIEAYTNALKMDKKLMGIKSRTDFDLRIETYEEIVKAAQKLKATFRK